MAATYERWLIAKGNSFSPGAAAVVKLVERLRKERWLAEPSALALFRWKGPRAERAKVTGGYAVTTIENTFGSDAVGRLAASTAPLPAALTPAWLDDADREELRLVWPFDGPAPLPVRYPLTRAPEGDVSYSLELHRSLEYVYPSADTIDAVSTTCTCGEDLAFEWDDEELVPAFAGSTGIFAECEECSRTFDPSKGHATITNPFDGTSAQVAGGAAYRFALKVDCGKCFVADPKLAFAPDLVALVVSEFGRPFYEVGARF
jgi:hypothetical protein